MTKSTLIVQNGSLIWCNEKGQVHRDNDKPAIIHSSGAKEWWANGECHRDNGKPAVVCPDGYKQWYVSGRFVKVE